MNEKKILILVMTCNLDYYRPKERVIRETWAKSILEGKVSNVDLWFFSGGDENCIDTINHRIFVKCNDGRFHTFPKLCKTLTCIDNYEDIFHGYDYVVRVNISTVLNISLIKEFVRHISDPDEIWFSTSFNQPWICNHLPFLSGECFFLSQKQKEILLSFYNNYKKQFDDLEIGEHKDDVNLLCDDGWITKIFADFYGESYLDKINCFGIVYEPFPELHFQEKYNTHLCITYKSDDSSDTILRDNHPINLDVDLEKCKEISSQIRFDVPVWWYDYWRDNIKNKECLSSLHRCEDNFITLKEVKERFVRWWKEEIDDCDLRPEIDESKIYKFDKVKKPDWKKYFDHIYCVHYIEYKEREEELKKELERVGILDSGIFSFKYTFSSPIDKVLYESESFSRERFNKRFSIGAYNLAKGHYDCMKESLGLGYKRVLFLEDDVAFLKDLEEITRILEASPHADIEMYDKVAIRGMWNEFKKKLPINKDYVGYNLLWTTSCYSCNRKGMEHITTSQEKKFQVADYYTNALVPFPKNGGLELVNDGIKRAVAIKNIACQKPAGGETINEHGETNWVYNQQGLESCDLNPELYNL